MCKSFDGLRRRESAREREREREKEKEKEKEKERGQHRSIAIDSLVTIQPPLYSITKYLSDVRGCMDSDFKFRALRTVPILKSFTDKDLLDLTPYFEEQHFEDKEYIISEGEIGNTFYIIKSGVVLVNSSVIDMRTPSSTFTSKSTHIKNDYFGEIALITGGRRTANVIAKGKVECFSIERGIFNKTMGSMKDRMNTYILSRTLEHVPITSGLSPEENASLCTKFKLERYEDGEYVVKQVRHRGREGRVNNPEQLSWSKLNITSSSCVALRFDDRAKRATRSSSSLTARSR